MDDKPEVQLFGTSELCFDKDSFMRPDFNVDDFMREYQCSGDANLETLRDHLGIYLKILRSAMIDLINRDYADFVNLSSNLTGLDSLIQALTVPLGQLREEVLSVSQLLETASAGVLTDLEKQRTVNEYKKKLTTLTDIANRLDNLEDLIHRSGFDNDGQKTTRVPRSSDNTDTGSSPNKSISNQAGQGIAAVAGRASIDHALGDDSITDDLSNLCLDVCSEEELLDRFAAEISYLNHLASTCYGTKLMEIYKPRLARIHSSVEAGIERNLKAGLGYSNHPGAGIGASGVNVALLRRTLIACTMMNSTAVAEEVVREMLAPRIKEVLSDSSLRSNPRGLSGIITALLALLHSSLSPLLTLTVPHKISSDSASEEEVPGLLFIEHSVFPEVVTALSALPDFYSPANPAAFHQRYLQCIELIESLELLLVTRKRVDAFRALDVYQKFMEQWNLAVYFQIRNQEIGQVVESSMCEELGIKLYLSDQASNEDQTNASIAAVPELLAPGDGDSNAAVAVLGSTRGVLRGIAQCWQPEVFLAPVLHRFWKLTLLVLSRHRTWLSTIIATLQEGDTSKLLSSRPVSATRTGSQHRGTPPPPASTRPASIVHLTVYLLADTKLLQDHLALLYQTSIYEHVKHVPEQHRNMIKDTLESEAAQLTAFHESLLSLLVKEVSNSMTKALQPVTDTPRLYRRTNRAAPSQAQQYVSSVVAPLQQLHDVAASRLPLQLLHTCYDAITAAVAAQYYTLTSEVLGNVSKTEESLKRLKRARGNTATPSPQVPGLTDEDKIREQLHRDVIYFGDKLQVLGVSISEVSEFSKLSETVNNARTGTAAAAAAAVVRT